MLTEQNKKFVMEYIKRHCRGQALRDLEKEFHKIPVSSKENRVEW